MLSTASPFTNRVSLARNAASKTSESFIRQVLEVSSAIKLLHLDDSFSAKVLEADFATRRNFLDDASELVVRGSRSGSSQAGVPTIRSHQGHNTGHDRRSARALTASRSRSHGPSNR